MRGRAAREQVDRPVAGQEEPLGERGDHERAGSVDERIRWCRYRFHRGNPAVFLRPVALRPRLATGLPWARG